MELSKGEGARQRPSLSANAPSEWNSLYRSNTYHPLVVVRLDVRHPFEVREVNGGFSVRLLGV
jgi:hypothetical protein